MKFENIKGIVMFGGAVEYRGNTICDLSKVLRYPFKTNKPYQVNLSGSKYNKETKMYEGDVLFNDLNKAVRFFIDECRKYDRKDK
jgi:hypothetical protein